VAARVLTLERTQPLDPQKHDRAEFTCGVSELDRFIKQQARKESDLNYSNTFVLTAKEEPKRILGYYSLSADGIPTSELPAEVTQKLPRYNRTPVTLLGRMAVSDTVDQDQRKDLRLGEVLITDAKFRAWSGAQSIASFAIVVDVLVGEKGDPTEFYEKYDFVKFPDTPGKLYLPIDTIEKTLMRAGIIKD
jgi:hypothetical protein